MILLGDFNTHNPLWRSEKIRTRGRMLKKILKILRFNEKEETNYRAYNGCESTIDLTIGPEYKWSKEYKLRGSDLVSYPSFYISSNIHISPKNLIIFYTSQLFLSSVLMSPWMLYFFYYPSNGVSLIGNILLLVCGFCILHFCLLIVHFFTSNVVG